ncbi:MAG: aminoacyl-tRNA hydrolase [Candidatus Roizmanbacteria bacterium]|nr:aminoacyl-tRNA hydrolase [Candidatus Roizmanbacteria bacterium]
MTMRLIVGLGNPGEKYKGNRHSVGFMFVDYLAQESLFKHDKYLLSDVCEVDKDMIFVKPQTYMNKSGDAVAACIKRYSIEDTKNNLVVIHDDLDIPFGKFKIQLQGPKQHNGLTDIQNKLRTMDFIRIRIGVDNRPLENRMNGEEYVLQNFTEDEKNQLTELFKKIDVRFKAFLQSENNCS